MPLELRLTPQAETDIAAIWEHTLATWGRHQAHDYLAGLDATIDLLRDFPEMAPLHPEFSPPVRIRPSGSHLIVYIFDETTLTILRILPARSDWTTVLGQ